MKVKTIYECRTPYGSKWYHTDITLWQYKKDLDTGYKTTKSWSLGICLFWWNKPWTWFRWYDNGAQKGIDKCYDFHIHFFVFRFNYTNYDYNLEG